MKRQVFLSSGAAAAAAIVFAPKLAGAAGQSTLKAIERRTGGRLGVYAIDMQSSAALRWRSAEQFAMCSTFKFPLVACVLSRVDRGRESLERRVHFNRADLLDYAPVARANVARGYLSVRELCAAAIEHSDNTAANLLLHSVGGPTGLTHFLRAQGDGVTRLDRYEPALNTAYAGDPRDTTTPFAMAADFERFLLGSGLKPTSQALLVSWLRANTTGKNRLRAAFPASWRAGDKTGTGGGINSYGDSDTGNDVAIAWPPGRGPLIVAVYLTGCRLRAAERDAAIADAGRAAIRAIAMRPQPSSTS